MGKFGFNELLNAKSKTSGTVSVEDFTEIWLSPYEVKPSASNFYSQENIEELADSFLAVGQQQPVILGRINEEFRIVSGHRRNRALILNIERGYKEFEKARYLYRDMTETMFELSLLIGNAYNRELTPWEKTQQAQKLKAALQKAKQEDGLRIQGKLRDTIADIMNESSRNGLRRMWLQENPFRQRRSDRKKKLPQKKREEKGKLVRSRGKSYRNGWKAAHIRCLSP